MKNARKLKFYIATGLANGNGIYQQAKNIVEALGHEVTYDWSVHGPVWSEGKERIEAVACDELRGVYCADVVLVLLPGGRGTHVELGMALAWNKPVVLHSTNDGVFGATPETCAFYHFTEPETHACWLGANPSIERPQIYTASGPLQSIAVVIAGVIERLSRFQGER